jgi:ribosomal protein L29
MDLKLSFAEISSKSKQELVEMLRHAKAEVNRMRIMSNPSVKFFKRFIARIKTAMNCK